MRVFVTGATGFVGSAVAQDLIAAGHQVLGLTRSETGARLLEAAGAEVHQGSLEDTDSLARGAAAADGVIHTAFNHDFSRFVENCAEDRRAIEAMGAALEGTTKPLLVTSGTLMLTEGGRLATEDDLMPANPSHPRQSEAAASALAARGIKASIVRLPPSVHGRGDHGFVPLLINLAREKGVAAYIGDGSNRWSAVHRFDAAPVYRLALERGEGGARYHAIDEGAVPFKDIAAAIGAGLGVPVVSLPPQEAADHFGWFIRFAGADSPTSSAWTREVLGWSPKQPGLLEDMRDAGYFR
ncbi:MAG: SDR family oxidoreductase [Caulobacter sp.]|nr:SDR family oxidoreductase [Caulobacter sp.]